jgi:hypothetical protein
MGFGRPSCADGRDQRCQPKRAAQGLVRHALNRPIIDRRNQHGKEHARRQSYNNREGAIETIQQGKKQNNERYHGAHHEHVAMGEVDHSDDTVNHRISDGDEPVD